MRKYGLFSFFPLSTKSFSFSYKMTANNYTTKYLFFNGDFGFLR